MLSLLLAATALSAPPEPPISNDLVVRRSTEPSYPPDVLDPVDVRCVLKVHIRPNGKPFRIEPQQTCGEPFEDASTAALRDWRWERIRRQPDGVSTLIALDFRAPAIQEGVLVQGTLPVDTCTATFSADHKGRVKAIEAPECTPATRSALKKSTWRVDLAKGERALLRVELSLADVLAE